jgi:transposase
MEGITIEEMAKRLGKPYKTIAQRILRGGYEPVFSGNLYSKEAFEEIKKSRGKGRPRKTAEEKQSRKPKTPKEK